MILVLASPVDRVASEFVRQAGGSARLLTCPSLSMPGWRLSVPHREPAMAVVDGERVPACEITAVITRLPYVGETELPQIAAPERAYVASEMQAFLHAFLSSLPCPVINRPTPVCLAGPNWRRAQWCRAAREAGLRVFSGEWSRPPWTVSLIGEECVGAFGQLVRKGACRLAQSAGATMLRLWFCGEPDAPLFAGADLWPDISEPSVSAALMNLIGAGVPV